MAAIKFSFSAIVLSALCWISFFGAGALPPLGKLLNPFTGFWQNAEISINDELNLIKLKGITQEVDILYDERMVPHIFAQNQSDLYYAQGYVTASFRLWQMDMQTRAAGGRLSEVAGEKTLEKDREARRLGLVYGAENSLKAMMSDPETARIINAYTAGINDYIESLTTARLPLEYKLLNFKPEKWSPLKTALLLSYMGNMLTGNEYDIENTNTRKLIGDSVFNSLFPDFPDTLLDPVIPKGTLFTKINPDNQTAQTTSKVPKNLKIFEKSPDDVGSNNWAVSGNKSTLGKPILCDDMHLNLNLPSIWFEIQLHTPEMNVYGVSLPGAPGIIVGFNDSIAWGLTNAAMDVKDWYEITFQDQSQSHYLLDSAWIKTEAKAEIIKVKGKADFIDTVYYTHWGPVAYDKNFGTRNSGDALALKWTLHLPSNELKTIALLNRAKNYEEYTKAISFFQNPGQNFVFASATGDIAIHHQGLFVNRKNGQGKVVQNGSTRTNDWSGFIPTIDNPHILNPERNFVSSANQHPTDQTYPYYYSGIYEYFRNRRINDVLSSQEKMSVADMQRLQNDNLSIYAREALPILLKNILNSSANQSLPIIQTLKNWDYYYQPESEAAVFFELWWAEFRSLLWDEFYTADRPVAIPNFAQTIRYLQKTPEGLFTDNKTSTETENLEQLCLQSFDKALKEYTNLNDDKKTWSAYKNTTIKHLSTLPAFSVSGVECGGNSGIVNATRGNYGPSWRMIVVPGDANEAYGVYPGGQSGNPGSRYYVNFIEQWASGKYFKLKKFTDSQSTEHVVFKQNFKP